MNSNNSSIRSSREIPRRIVLIFIGLGFLGFLDSLYLTIEHYLGAEVVCTIVEGCNEVLQSKYAIIFGIPLSLVGVGYYTAVILLSFAFLDTKAIFFMRAMGILTSFGFLFSIVFVSLQQFVLHAYCIYCLGSALISTILFLFSAILYMRYIRLKSRSTNDQA